MHSSISRLFRPLLVVLAVVAASGVLAAPTADARSNGVADQVGRLQKDDALQGKKIGTRAAGDDSVALSGPFKFKPIAPGAEFSYDIVFGNSGSTTWDGAGHYAFMNVTTGRTWTIEGTGCDPIRPGQACVGRFTGHVENTPGPWKAAVFYSMAQNGEPFGQRIKVKVVVQ